MLRVSLLLATASIALYFAGGPNVLLEAKHSAGHLVSSSSTTGNPWLDRPAIRVTSAPTDLELGQSGTAEVQADAPAATGTTIYLRTAGSYGLGYYNVSSAVLDANLHATLKIPGRGYTGTFNYWATIPASATYQEGTSASWPITFAPAAPPAAPKCSDDVPTTLRADGSPWVCTYDDEFNGTTLDRRFWVPQVTASSGTTTGTTWTYACAADSPDTIAEHDGNLELSLVELPAPVNCGQGKTSRYAFGQVMHYQTYSQTYGKYEIRAKLPDLTAPGAQETFWLWPTTNSYGYWPASGEIDFAELYSRYADSDKPFIHYYPGTTATGTNQNVTTARCPIKLGEFNTYGLEWKPGQLKILLNGDVCMIDDYSSALGSFQGKYSPFDKPFFLTLTQAMGTTGNEYDTNVVPNKVSTLVDYVRIWK